MRPACLVLFAGGGGSTIGIERAGFDCFGVEWDAAAAMVHAAHAGPCVRADVREHVAWMPEVLRWLDGRSLTMWASPPCQAWSSAGKRLGAADDRNGWPWTWEAVDALRAAGVVVNMLVTENVAGMLHHATKAGCGRGARPAPVLCGGCYWSAVVVPELSRRFPRVAWRVLDAVDYGVPQHRSRLIMVASHERYAWPAPKACPPGALPMGEQWRTVRDALGHSVVGGGTRGRGMAEWRPRECDDVPSPTVSTFGSAGALYVRTENTGAAGRSVTEPAPTTGTKGTLYVYSHDPGVRGLDAPCTTVTATEGRGCASDARRASRTLGRRATPEECALLQGWPEVVPHLALCRRAEDQYRIAGNAVPPELAAAVMGVVRA